MQDMPRIITYTTSSVLRLLVVYHRCVMCVCTKSVMIARRSDTFVENCNTTLHTIITPHKAAAKSGHFEPLVREVGVHTLLYSRKTGPLRSRTALGSAAIFVVAGETPRWNAVQDVSFAVCEVAANDLRVFPTGGLETNG